ncbi:hypothetical protein CCMSSC00406_0010163 [Pleurotus cornucopiae]|uniref:Uncharacterized protein n=1 Tax=Pleurotus cornucopiae TaxID=5321 RepID=A0ACB7IKY4_PLECO|nr:hypothetical protein CCMSSC00406_0010163 [Pleurotus cornucopiae]
MASTNGHYDQSLLAAAPKATQSQLQEGYNPDLLNESTQPPPRDIESAHASKEYLGTQPTPVPTKVPFWRTTKGIIIIAVAVVVVIGAVVGGAVGGTVGKKKSSDNSGSLETGDSGSQEQPGAAPAVTTTSTTPAAGPTPQQNPTTADTGTDATNAGNTGAAPPANPNPPASGTGGSLAALGNAVTPASPEVLGVDTLI